MGSSRATLILASLSKVALVATTRLIGLANRQGSLITHI